MVLQERDAFTNLIIRSFDFVEQTIGFRYRMAILNGRRNINTIAGIHARNTSSNFSVKSNDLQFVLTRGPNNNLSLLGKQTGTAIVRILFLKSRQPGLRTSLRIDIFPEFRGALVHMGCALLLKPRSKCMVVSPYLL